MQIMAIEEALESTREVPLEGEYLRSEGQQNDDASNQDKSD